MEVWGADIGNRYLEATTKEKLYIVPGSEFEELQGHILVIHKALYGLKSSGLRWSQRFHDIMLQLGFKPCKADPCVWLRKMKNKCEYIAIYVDDLLIASEKPHQIIQDLKEKFKLKIKGDGSLDYHLGCDYKPDKHGTLAAQPTKYINKILESYKKMFPNEHFLNVKSPLEKDDHPELDNTKLCNEEQITKYMCMIGQLQWAITLGRYDILAYVIPMSRFRLAPKIGHLEVVKRVYGYLVKTKHFAIRYTTEEPDYSHLPKQEYEWTTTVYGNVKVEIPKDIPKPLGKRVVTTTFLDANLFHDIVTGKSVTAVLDFVNTTLTDWFSKTQATVETATYGSELVAAKTATEQIMNLRNTLRYLGVPIITKAYMFGDSCHKLNHTSIHSQQKTQHVVISWGERSHCCQQIRIPLVFI